MTTAEAAQAWAEANEALAKAREAMIAAQDTYMAADSADKQAWETLQTLSGRGPVAPFTDWPATANGQGLNQQQSAHYQFDDGFKR